MRGRGGEGKMIGGRTEAMNMPKRPPMPKPITPDMTVLPRHDSIAACICPRCNERKTEPKTSAISLHVSFPGSRSFQYAQLTALTFGSCAPPGWGKPPEPAAPALTPATPTDVPVGMFMPGPCTCAGAGEMRDGSSNDKNNYGDKAERRCYGCNKAAAAA